MSTLKGGYITPLFFIFIFSLVLRIIFFFQIKDLYFINCFLPHSDSDFYLFLGKFINENYFIVSEHPYYYSFSFAYLVSIFFRLFGENIWYIQLFNIIIGSSVPVAVYLIVNLILKNKVLSFSLGIFSSLLDLFLIYDLLFLKTTLGIFSITWGFYFYLKYLYDSKNKSIILSGLFFSLAVTVYANFIAVILGLTILLLKRKPLSPAVLFLSISLISVAFASIRNYIVSHDIIFMTAIGGIHFYIGNNTHATGMYTPIKGVRPSGFGHYFDGKKLAETLSGKRLKPSEVSNFFKTKAFEEMEKNPKYFVKLYIKKFILLFNHFDIPNNINKHFIKSKVRLYNYFSLSFGLFTFLGLVGFFLSLRNPEFIPIHIFFVLYSASVLLFFITDRYRLPLVIPLIIYTSYLIRYIVVEPSVSKRIIIGFMLIASFMFVYQKTDIENLRFDRETSGKEFIAKRLCKLRSLLKEEKNVSKKSEILTTLAELYIKANCREQARYLLEKSLQLNPDNKKALFYLKSITEGRKVILY